MRNRVVQQLRAITWPEITSLVRSGLSGYWSLAIFLIVGHAAAHITGPSIVVSVIIAAISSVLSGKKYEKNVFSREIEFFYFFLVEP